MSDKTKPLKHCWVITHWYLWNVCDWFHLVWTVDGYLGNPQGTADVRPLCPTSTHRHRHSTALLAAHMHRFNKGKKVKVCIAVNKTQSHSYGVSLAIWDHSVLTVTWHKRTHPALTAARQAGTRFTYPRGMEGWVDLGDLLHTEMVYPPADGHPCNY